MLTISTVLPLRVVHHVAGPGRAGVGHVLGASHQADDAAGRFELAEGFEQAHDRGRAAHVALHFPHPGGGLDGDPAAVEGDALAHRRTERSFVGVPGGGVLKDDRGAESSAEPAATAANAPMPRETMSSAFEHFAVHVVASGELAGFFRHVFRREAVGRGVGKVACEDDGFGHGLSPRRAARRGKPGTLASQNRRASQRGSAFFGLFGLERLVAPQAEHGGADDFFNGALDIGVEAGQTGNGEGERVHAKFAAADGCGPGALADLLKRSRIRQRVEFAEADHDGAGQRVCGRAVEEAHFAFFPVEVAHPRRDGHPRRGVQQFRG